MAFPTPSTTRHLNLARALEQIERLASEAGHRRVVDMPALLRIIGDTARAALAIEQEAAWLSARTPSRQPAQQGRDQ